MLLTAVTRSPGTTVGKLGLLHGSAFMVSVVLVSVLLERGSH